MGGMCTKSPEEVPSAKATGRNTEKTPLREGGGGGTQAIANTTEGEAGGTSRRTDSGSHGSSSRNTNVSSEEAHGLQESSEKDPWKHNVNTQRKDIKKVPTKKGGSTPKHHGTGDESPKSTSVILSRSPGFTIMLTPDPKDKGDDKDDSEESEEEEISSRYAPDPNVPLPTWLAAEPQFYGNLSQFLVKCKPKVKKAIWKKCFERKTGVDSSKVLDKIDSVDDISKILTAVVLIYLRFKDKSKKLLKEKEVKPHLKGCATYISDIHRELKQDSFVDDKSHVSNILTQYQGYLDDLEVE